jgi:hypothetical protein
VIWVPLLFFDPKPMKRISTRDRSRTVTVVKLVAVIATLVTLTSLSSMAQATQFYVATNGNDASDGSIGAPFLTLTQAQAAVRAALPAATGPVNVWVRGGTYYLAQPLVFSTADSGSQTVPVTYASYSNETAVISGAVRLTPSWSPFGPNTNILAASIGTGYNFDLLFVNGINQVMARYPNYSAATNILNGYAADCILIGRQLFKSVIHLLN